MKHWMILGAGMLMLFVVATAETLCSPPVDCNYTGNPIAPGLCSTPTPVPPPTEFVETFDGAPTLPDPWDNSNYLHNERFDVVLDPQDGQIDIEPNFPHGDIIAGHGSNCSAPPNTHTVLLDESPPIDHQAETRQHLMFMCNNHMMSTVHSGYAVATFMPRAVFDLPVTISIDTGCYGFGREWWDAYITPREDELAIVAVPDEGGTAERFPKDSVRFGMLNGKPGVMTIDEYTEVDDFNSFQRFRDAFPSDPCWMDTAIRRTFRFTLTADSWLFEIEKQDGTFWVFEDETFDNPLPAEDLVVRFEHHSYNPTKDCVPDSVSCEQDGVNGAKAAQRTFHWDDLIITNTTEFPAGYEPNAPHFLDMLHATPSLTNTVQTQITVPSAGQYELHAHLNSFLNFCDVDWQNDAVASDATVGWRQVRINGGSWMPLDLVKQENVTTGNVGCDRTWSSTRVLVTAQAGVNIIEFRYPVRPSEATWQYNGFQIKDVELRVP